MLSPKRTKYRKSHRPKLRFQRSRVAVSNPRRSTKGTTIRFGEFALQARDPGWITSRQIEAGRRAMSRYARRGGKLWIRIFPDRPVTFRPADSRMGSGKGAVEHWVRVVQPGTILYELKGVPAPTAHAAMRIAGHKLPVRTKILRRSEP